MVDSGDSTSTKPWADQFFTPEQLAVLEAPPDQEILLFQMEEDVQVLANYFYDLESLLVHALRAYRHVDATTMIIERHEIDAGLRAAS